MHWARSCEEAAWLSPILVMFSWLPNARLLLPGPTQSQSHPVSIPVSRPPPPPVRDSSPWPLRMSTLRHAPWPSPDNPRQRVTVNCGCFPFHSPPPLHIFPEQEKTLVQGREGRQEASSPRVYLKASPPHARPRNDTAERR